MNNLKEIIGNTDIYLIDQILKNRYNPTDTIFDAGCGNGRNIKWFYDNGYNFYGVDMHTGPLNTAKERYPLYKNQLIESGIENLAFESEKFNHIICNAVLHFAKNTDHFKKMFAELVRVLKPKGSLFIRMSSTIGFENFIEPITDGVYKLPNGSYFFLLTQSLLKEQMDTHNLSFLEPLKTVIVDELRTMTTLVLTKM